MAHVSHRLSNSFEGALAGGGDPATSPLYIFGPFLRLIVVAGVAQVTFGASVWLVVLTVATVSAMYRQVMTWVTDGSGGSGLNEEEFGSWAVKVNAGITFVEYTLTFLVSMAALVTFMADRYPVLNTGVLGFQHRTLIAIALSVITGWIVNRGPRMAARAFGPATFAVLLLLWAMVVAVLWKLGLHLPHVDWRAFSPDYLHFTFGGFARLLALMTGIEVFANRQSEIPILLIRPTEEWRSRRTQFIRLLVGLDGSSAAEQVLRYARALARKFGSEILVLGVPEADSEESSLREYVEKVADALRARSLRARALVTGSGPARTLVAVSEAE
jgi:hypothetical protein